jgi:hypothetical protein
MKNRLWLAAPLALVAATSAFAPSASASETAMPALPPYPANPQVPLVEDHFGQKVSDPWRWLEADVRTDAVAAWSRRRAPIPLPISSSCRNGLRWKKRMKALIDYERFGLPVRRGANLFYTWNSGLMNQSQLLVRPVDAAVGTKGRVLLDPNTWAKDGATALDAWAPSDDGRLLAYSVQDGGSDWRTVKFATVADGKPLADELKWVKFSGLAWLGNDAVLYSRSPSPSRPGIPGVELQPDGVDASSGHAAKRGPDGLRDARPAQARPWCQRVQRRALGGDQQQRGHRSRQHRARRPRQRWQDRPGGRVGSRPQGAVGLRRWGGRSALVRFRRRRAAQEDRAGGSSWRGAQVRHRGA